jgi:hypothetical protein
VSDETALVGAPLYLTATWRDAAGMPVWGAQTAVAYGYRQDESPIQLGVLGEAPPGSGAYFWRFTPLAPMAHHLWIDLYHAASGRSLHLATTVFAVSPALPIPHLVGLEQEWLWVILAPDGTPVHGATAAPVPGSVLAADAPTPTVTVVATPRDGAYRIRCTPLGAGFHRAELATTNQTPVQRVVLEFDAAPAGPPLPQPVSPASGSVAWTDLVPSGAVAWTEVPG